MTADPGTAVVFSGAGLSAAEPAALPLGFDLRNQFLDLCYEEAHALAPSLADDMRLRELRASMCKLEVVLGRVAGTVGPEAMNALKTLDIAIPNEAHMLTALAVAHGGSHITVNFDEGLERAYRLLAGLAALPLDASPALHSALPSWRARMPANPESLRVVASHAEFDQWVWIGEPPAVLKIHGSIRSHGGRAEVVDPVVEDETEYTGLTKNRLRALDRIGMSTTVIITGYRGLDIDVYDALIDRLEGKVAKGEEVIWAAPKVEDEVRRDVDRLGGTIVDRDPAGRANIVLRHVFGWDSLPAWPEVTAPGATFRDRATAWEDDFRSLAPWGTRAEAYGWILADLGHYDDAQRLLAALHDHRRSGRRPPERLTNRLADVMYDRNAAGDRAAAARAWATLISRRSTSRGLRAYAFTRLGEIGRGVALHGPTLLRPLGLLAGVFGPTAALAVTRNGQVEPQEAARALSALSGLALRFLESLPPAVLLRGRALTAPLARAGDVASERAQALMPGGNRSLFVQQQRCELSLLSCLLNDSPASLGLTGQLQAIGKAYARADDIRGKANVQAALALAAIVERDSAAVKAFLDCAEELYATGRPGQRPDPSGIALVSRRRALARRLGLAL